MAVVHRASLSGKPAMVDVGKVFNEGYELMRAEHGDKLHAVAVCNAGNKCPSAALYDGGCTYTFCLDTCTTVPSRIGNPFKSCAMLLYL